MALESIDQLKSLFADPSKRALQKVQTELDEHSGGVIERSPFLVLSTASGEGQPEASPRGGRPGFVLIEGPKGLLIPDSPGNNRLDSLCNILETARVGLLFFVPGMDETLRVNGSAELCTDAQLLSRFAAQERLPKLVIRVHIDALYMHCAKALMRSKLWDPTRHIERSSFPSMGQILKDQIGSEGPAESESDMRKRYASDL